MTKPRPLTARWRAPRPVFAGLALVLAAGLTCAAIAGDAAAGNTEPSASGSGGPGLTVTEAGDPLGLPGLPRSTRPVRSQPSGAATVTLITGDQVRLETTTEGHQSVDLVRAADAGPSAPAVRFAWGRDQYLVPAEAVPYLGGVLDPALFNISYQVRAGLDDASRRTLPVTIEQAGGRAADLPAVRVARVTDRTATAAVAKTEAGAFGTRLGEVWEAARAGTSTTPPGRLPGIDRIALSVPAGAEPTPRLPIGKAGVEQAATAGKTRYHNITLDPIDRTGKPGLAIGFLHNLDNPRALAVAIAGAGAGALTFNVPEGRYGVEFSVLDGVSGAGAGGTLVIEPEVEVTSDRRVTLDARKGVRYQVNTDPAVQPGSRTDQLSFTRYNEQREGADTHNVLASLVMGLVSLPELGNPPLHAVPSAPATHGHLEVFGFTAFSDTRPGSVGPRYVFAYRWDRIPASLSAAVPRADLTTVRSDLYRSPSAANQQTTAMPLIVLTPVTRHNVRLGQQVPFGERVDYWYTNAPDTVVWAPYLFTDHGNHLYAARRTIRPGEEIRLVWNKGPAVPPPVAPYIDSTLFDSRWNGRTNGTQCAACRQDDNGVFSLWPSGDSSTGHYADSGIDSDPERWSFDFYRDGTLAMTSRNTPAGAIAQTNLLLPMLPEPAEYRLQWDISRDRDTQAWARTGWTFRSGRSDPRAALPGSAVCAPDTERACSFLPLLFPRYDLAVDVNGRALAGAPFELAFRIEHQQHQPAPTGVTASVSVSYDGGATWSEPIAATERDGRFTATVDHPPLASTDGFVALRVRAGDAAGNSVDQIITRAYGLTG